MIKPHQCQLLALRKYFNKKDMPKGTGAKSFELQFDGYAAFHYGQLYPPNYDIMHSREKEDWRLGWSHAYVEVRGAIREANDDLAQIYINKYVDAYSAESRNE